MAAITFTNAVTGAVTNLLDTNVLTSTIQGIESTATTNIHTVKLTAGDGEKVVSTDYDTRPITLQGTVTCDSSAALRTKLDNLKRDVAGKGYLDVTFDGGSTARYTVEVQNWVVTNSPYTLTWIPFALNFVAADTPFGEELSSSTLYSDSSVNSDLDQTDTLNGSADPAVTAQVTVATLGSLSGIEFRNESTNTGLLMQPTFAANDTVAIDTGKQSCLMNGLPVDFDGQVPTFLPGSNHWRLNFLTSSVTIDTQQTKYTTDKFIFGDTWLAQSFQPSAAIEAHRVDLMLTRLGNPSKVQVDIYTDSGSAPDSAISGATSTVLGENVPTTAGYVSFYLQNVAALSASTTYWIVVQVTGDTNDVDNGFYLKASDQGVYADGDLSRSSDSGSTWSTLSDTDAVFRVWKTPILVSNVDTSEESYTEDFSTTTNKDGTNTTANWDTTNKRLQLGNSGTTSDTGFLSPTVHPGSFVTNDTWTNQANVYVADGSFATHTTDLAVKQADDDQTYGSFSFNVPASNVVTGFDIKIKGKVNSGTGLLYAFLIFDSNNDGVLDINDLSSAISRGAVSFTLTSTNTEYTLSYSSGTWLGANITNTLFTLWLSPQTGSKTYSIDAAQVKAYYKSFDTTKNVGQSSALSDSDSLLFATARMAATEILPSGTSITYAVQGDASDGFSTVSNNTDTNMTVPDLGTAPSHKWKATLSGSASTTPVVDDLTLYYRGVMPLSATTDRLAQSFDSGAGGSISAVLLNMAKTASDTIDYTVEIQTDNSGSPSGTAVTNGTATIAAASVPVQTSGFSWVTATFATAPSLTASTTYWIVVKIGTAGSSKLLWRARGSDSYGDGAANYSTDSGSAYTELTNKDFLFQILSSGATFSTSVAIKYKARSL